MQIAVIEYARNVLGLADANSSEFDLECKHPVIYLMPDQEGVQKGGTMRLGAYPCKIVPGTKIAECYKKDEIAERHRHRYEFNNDYRDRFEQNGMKISGTSPDNKLVECVELPSENFFVAVQFHPEFKSRPNRPHPLFVGFVKAALENKK